MDCYPDIICKCLSPKGEINDEGVVSKPIKGLEKYIHLTVKSMILTNEGWNEILKVIENYTRIKVLMCVRENGKQNRPHIHLIGCIRKKVNPKRLQSYLNKRYNKTDFNCYATFPKKPLGEVWEYLFKEVQYQTEFID